MGQADTRNETRYQSYWIFFKLVFELIPKNKSISIVYRHHKFRFIDEAVLFNGNHDKQIASNRRLSFNIHLKMLFLKYIGYQ